MRSDASVAFSAPPSHHHMVIEGETVDEEQLMQTEKEIKDHQKQASSFFLFFFSFLLFGRVRGWACRCVAQRGRYLMLTTAPDGHWIVK